MSTAENAAIVRRVTEEIFSKGILSVADEVFGPTYVHRMPGMPDVHGPVGFKELVAMFRAAFPDLYMTIEDVISEGDKVVYRWRGGGTHKGELMGIPPTGKTIAVTGIVISRLSGGKIVEDMEIYDQLGLLQQLGVIPASR